MISFTVQIDRIWEQLMTGSGRRSSWTLWRSGASDPSIHLLRF